MQKPVEKPIKFIKNLATKGKSYPITHASAVIDDNGESIKSTIDSLKNKSSITKVTWKELKDKRDAGKLIPGALYRITDYQCTTTQENTQSAGHQFDIVLLALSENKLAEEGWAMMHDNIYDVTFDDGVTKKCWIYDNGNNPMAKYNIVDVVTLKGLVISMHTIEIDEEHKTAVVDSYYSDDLEDEGLTYDYFQNSNLSAWKVWYCLDNDKDRFAWAQIGQEANTESITVNSTVYNNEVFTPSNNTVLIDGIIYYLWNGDVFYKTLYTTSLNPKVGDSYYRIGGPADAPFVSEEIENAIVAVTGVPEIQEGRGVIYRLIDEFNNDIKYDFKNIQFKRKLTDGQYDATNGSDTWCYTLNLWYNDMCQDASIVGNTLLNDDDYISGVYDNKFGYALAYNLDIDGVDGLAFALGNNVALSYTSNDIYYGISSNTIKNHFYNNTIGNNFRDNIIGNSFNNNTIKNQFQSNTIGNVFTYNTIGNAFQANMIGNMFVRKTIGDNVQRRNYGNSGVELATKGDLNQ